MAAARRSAEPSERKARLRLLQELPAMDLTARLDQPLYPTPYEPEAKRHYQEPENHPAYRPKEFVNFREIPA